MSQELTTKWTNSTIGSSFDTFVHSTKDQRRYHQRRRQQPQNQDQELRRIHHPNAYQIAMTNIDDEESINMIRKPSVKMELSSSKRNQVPQAQEMAIISARDVTVEESHLDSSGDSGENDAMLTPVDGGAAGKKSNSGHIDEFTSDMDMVIDEQGQSINVSATLTPSSYSIIFVAPVRSWAFFYAIFAFTFQLTLAALTFSDLIDWQGLVIKGSYNLLSVPANVPWPVRVAGYMCMVLAVVYFTDLLDSIETLHEGYHPVIRKQAPHATKCKWILAYSLQLLSGTFFLGVIFILICRSNDVLSMLLNFAAMQFVTEIDDVAFSLAERGYFSLSLQEMCGSVTKLKTPESKGPWFRRIALFIFVLLAFTGYSYFFWQQTFGYYTCSRFEVQFGDEAWSWMPLMSGVYNNWVADKRESQRWVYVDETSESSSTFLYCEEQDITAWVFGVFSADPYNYAWNGYDDDWTEKYNDTYFNEVCENNEWFLRSPKTSSFSVLFGSASSWLTTTANQNTNDLLYPVDHLTMKCLDCDANTCNLKGGSCKKDRARSDTEICICSPGFYGQQCQFDNSTLCESITYGVGTVPFSKNGIDFPSTYTLVRDDNGDLMQYFDKAAYAHVYPEGDLSYGDLVMIAYFGRRYFFIEANWLADYPNATVDTAAAQYLSLLQMQRESGFRSLEDLDEPTFVSDPLNAGTMSDQFIPTQLGWYTTKLDAGGNKFVAGSAVNTKLVCEQCNDGLFCDSGECIYSNPEDEFGTCQFDDTQA